MGEPAHVHGPVWGCILGRTQEAHQRWQVGQRIIVHEDCPLVRQPLVRREEGLNLPPFNEMAIGDVDARIRVRQRHTSWEWTFKF